MLVFLAQFAIPMPMAPPMAPPIYRPDQGRRRPAYDPTNDYFKDRRAPQEMRSQPVYNEPGKQEVHGATTRENCRKMADNFRRQGRNVRLVDIRKSGNPGAQLEWACIFQGADAQTGYFDEKRY